MRFDMRAPDRTQQEVADLYQAAVEMAAWADERGCAAIALCEHHAADGGYLSSPLSLAAAMAAVTKRAPIMIAAAILPLYDPVRLAEEMIVLDHLSRGRVMYTLGLGYRPEEYDLYGVDFSSRGALADEKLATLLRLLREASPDGAGPQLDPRPFTTGGPMLAWGGASKPAARRAGRNGLSFIAQADNPALGDVYRDAAIKSGHEPGLCLLPSKDDPSSVFVHPDPDTGWQEVGEAMLADAVRYHAWNRDVPQAASTVSLSSSTTVEELRAEHGSHRVVTVEEAVALIQQYGMLKLQPLCGGLDPEIAWPYLHRVVGEVLPRAGVPVAGH